MPIHIDTFISRQKSGGKTCLPVLHTSTVLNTIAQKKNAYEITGKKILYLENVENEKQRLRDEETHRDVLLKSWHALEERSATLYSQVIALTNLFVNSEFEDTTFNEVLVDHLNTTDFLQARIEEYRQKFESIELLRNDTSPIAQKKAKRIAMQIKKLAQDGLSEMDKMEPMSVILRNIQKCDAKCPFHIVHPYFPVHWQDYECSKSIKLPLVEHMSKLDQQLDLDLHSLELVISEDISNMDEFRVGHLFDLYQAYVPDAQRDQFLMQRLNLEYSRGQAKKILQQMHINRKRARQKQALVQAHGKMERIQNAIEVMHVYNQTEAIKLYNKQQLEISLKESQLANTKIQEWRDQCMEKANENAALKERQLQLEKEKAKMEEERRDKEKEHYLKMKEEKLAALAIEKAKEQQLLEQLAREVALKLEKERTIRVERTSRRNKLSKDMRDLKRLKKENALSEKKRNEEKLIQICEKLREKIQVHRDPERLQKPTLASNSRQAEMTPLSTFSSIPGYSDEHMFRDQRFKFLALLEDHQFSSQTRSYLKQVFANLKPCKPYANEWKSQIELGTNKQSNDDLFSSM